MFKSAIARCSGAYLFVGICAVLSFFYITQAQAGQLTLAWDASTSSGVAGYEINYGQASGSYTTQVDAGNKTSYTLTGLQDGKKYYFAAKAYNSGKTAWSGFSNEVSATTAPATTAPVASFTAGPSSGVAPLTVTFTDTSTGNITAWLWDFDDGPTSTAKNAAKTYTNPGSYTVRLTVTGPAGSNTATKTISVAAPGAAPVANFSASPTSGPAPLAVVFTNSSTNATSYSWDFNGNGTTDSTEQNPLHTYTTVGTYTVSLTAKGAGGTNTKTQSGYITVSPSSGGGSGSNAGLVGYYGFEEASGTTVVDASGQGNTGTISGATRITQGHFGKALSFDGINDWVTIDDSASLDLTTGMTLEAWVYPTVHMSQWATVVLKEQPDGGLYELYANGDKSQPLTSVTVGGQYQVLSAGPWLLANQWTHLAATYDGTTQRLYVDGTQVAQRSQSGPIQVSGSPLRLGGNSVWGEFFEGRIDEVRIYNKTLSAAQIQVDMNTAIATTSTCTGNSVWPATAVPGNAADPDTAAVELGLKFRSDVNGMVCGVLFYKSTANTGTHVGKLWSSSGQLLAQATFTNETASGWQQVNFATPVPITANTVYVVSYHAPNGRYSVNEGYFAAAGVDNPPLHALRDGVSGGNGVYRYGAGGFPTDTNNTTNYWVDVVFTASGG